jgi:undecaprenyl-diphosphatase
VSVSEALVLGIVQGLTEFLPVSSSGHMSLVELAFGMRDTSEMMALDVAFHAATLAAILVYFTRAWIARLRSEPKAVVPVALACVPAVVLYLLAGESVEAAGGSLWALGAAFIVAGGYLCVTTLLAASSQAAHASAATGVSCDRRGLLDALTIGVAQAVALFPGVSRSGATIGTALMRGTAREVAFDFSFLIGAPLMAGALLVKAADVARVAQAGFGALAAGAAVAFATGLAALALLRRAVLGGRLWVFGAYAMCVGCACLAWAVGRSS